MGVGIRDSWEEVEEQANKAKRMNKLSNPVNQSDLFNSTLLFVFVSRHRELCALLGINAI